MYRLSPTFSFGKKHSKTQQQQQQQQKTFLIIFFGGGNLFRFIHFFPSHLETNLKLSCRRAPHSGAARTNILWSTVLFFAFSPPPPINKYANKQREKNGRDSPLQSVVPSFHCKSSTFFFFVQSYIFSLPSSVFAAVAGSIPARSSSASSLLSAHACRAAASAEVPPA